MSSLKCKKKIQRELKKGRFLCVQCHRNETYKENQKIVERYMQSLVLASTQKFQRNGTSCHGIICQGRCLKQTHFNIYKSKCDSCVSLERIMKRKVKQTLINNEKIKFGCCEYCHMTCTNYNCHVFEWDHIFGKNKKVSKLLDSSDKAIMNEIRLCRLLCSKCHRLKSIPESPNMWNDKRSDFRLILYDRPKEDILIKFNEENPKREGSMAHQRYEQYKYSKTLTEAREMGMLDADFKYDKWKGFVEIV